MPPAAICCEDGRLLPDCQLTPSQFLTRHSSGVYTTALVTPDGLVMEWELHRKRLLRGVELLNTRPSRPFDPFFAALGAQGPSLDDFFRSHVVPAVRAALAAHFGHGAAPPDGTQAGQAGHPSTSAGEAAAEAQREHVMLIVCVSPGHGSCTAAADGSVVTQPEGGETEETEGDWKRDGRLEAARKVATARAAPEAVAGSSSAAGSDRAGSPQGTSPEAGTGGGASASLPVSVAAYCKAVHLSPYGPEHAVQAAVLGRPRSIPGAKASSWVQERRQYEGRKPPEAAEVLLSDADGRILEGLVTNFCVIVVPPKPTAATTTNATATESKLPTAPVPEPLSVSETDDPYCSAAPPACPATGQQEGESMAPLAPPPASLPPAELHVCGPEAQAALPGVIQSRVVEAARRLGLQVVPEPPRAADRGTWSEAFVTNCLRRIQPLSRVFCPPDNAWGADPWDCRLPAPAGPYTTALRRELEQLEERTHWSQL